MSIRDTEEDEQRTEMRTMTELPDDLIIEILVRSPVKSLLRFKSVCRAWYVLVTSPDFVANHNIINKSKKTSVFCCPLCFHDDETYDFIFHFSDVQIDLKLRRAFRGVRILGCCSGVFGLSLLTVRSRVFALWNPATKLFRTIGDFRNPVTLHYCGFCYNPVANSYKVVVVSFPPHEYGNPQQDENTNIKINILTVSKNSRREKNLIVPNESSIVEDDLGLMACVDRYMYWVVGFNDNRDTHFEKYMLCYDMIDEVFKRIELPHKCQDSEFMKPASYKDAMALFVHREVEGGRGSFDVWVMNDCGGTSRQSWSHQLAIVLLEDLRCVQGFFSKDGVDLPVVVTTHDDNLLFDPESETTMFFSQASLIHFFHYNESLLSF